MRHVKKIYNALRKKDGLRQYWIDPTFDCFERFTSEVREVMATVAVESQLANGGPSQLLWNCKAHWRTLLNLAEKGYKRFGPEEAAIEVGKLSKVFPSWEKKLEEFQKCRGVTAEIVGQWWLAADNKISASAKLGEFPFEQADQRREEYLESHVDRLVQEIKKTR